MQPEFWQQRWREQRIGFHQDHPTALMLKHWPMLDVAPGAQVFVPLAGKSLDMVWLASQGHRVLGVELSQLAVEQFFDENQLSPVIRETKYGRHYVAGLIDLVCGDAFGLDADVLRDCMGVFDRAALVALPADLRQRYAREVYANLPHGCHGLLVTLEYPQHEKDGPPFSVDDAEVHALYAREWAIDLLERERIVPGGPRFEEGLSRLEMAAYGVRRY
ncbi:thiopurine S-methyltransferase [Solilutibacter silvestris]|uniref:Thiopurine S-methyltransferase n=1 Tax=Solilutibacter silvestris TaxID=1645665 RepID=A0A2K1Q3E5_9GAMM|nr:thiopurine S-methyltransferase [Lysobacter silvestris]PNS09570.1 thiopurine S-methyltransferase [Lysobacter silvestris]